MTKRTLSLLVLSLTFALAAETPLANFFQRLGRLRLCEISSFQQQALAVQPLSWPNPTRVAAVRRLENWMVALSLQNMGAEIEGSRVVVRNSLRRIKALLPDLARLGVGKIYLYGPYQPSPESQQIHFNPALSGEPRYIYDGRVMIRVADYPTRRVSIGSVQLTDANGNIFSNDGQTLNRAMDERNPEAAFKETIQLAHDLGLTVVTDGIPRLAPTAINETNYRMTHFIELTPSEHAEFLSLRDDAIEAWLRGLVNQHKGFFAVRLNESGQPKVVLVKHVYDGNNVDQAELNPAVDQAQAFLIEIWNRWVDMGIDEIRLDLPDLLFRFFGVEGRQPQEEYLSKVLDGVKKYAKSVGRRVRFIAETYEWGENTDDTRLQEWMLAVGADQVYSKRFFETYAKLVREGSPASRFESAVWATRGLPLLSFLSNFDQVSLRGIGGTDSQNQAAFMLGLAVTQLHPAIGQKPDSTWMIDWRDLLGFFGEDVPVVGGGSGQDPTNLNHHLLAHDPEELYAQTNVETERLALPNSPLAQVARDFEASVPSSRETYVDMSDSRNQDPDRFYTLSWKMEDGDWMVLTVDFKAASEGFDNEIWLKAPQDAGDVSVSPQRTPEQYDVLDLLNPSAKLKLVSGENGTPTRIRNVTFSPLEPPYRLLRLQQKTNRSLLNHPISRAA